MGLDLALAASKWPCHYLDFETVATTLPLYDGYGCHDQVLTQFSVHHRDSLDAEPSHSEFLAPDLAYLARPLTAISRRLVDFEKIIRKHIYHPAFGGSFSLKKVVTTLVTDVGYNDLAVRDGSAAIALFAQMARGEVEDVDEARRNLLAYCRTDTLVMVRLHETGGDGTAPAEVSHTLDEPHAAMLPVAGDVRRRRVDPGDERLSRRTPRVSIWTPRRASDAPSGQSNPRSVQRLLLGTLLRRRLAGRCSSEGLPCSPKSATLVAPPISCPSPCLFSVRNSIAAVDSGPSDPRLLPRRLGLSGPRARTPAQVDPSCSRRPTAWRNARTPLGGA